MGGASMKLSGFGRAAIGALWLLGGTGLASAQGLNYHLIKTIPLPQAPGSREYFDYLTMDSDARRLYVTHGTEVVVLNADDHSIIGRIGGLQLAHGVVIVKDIGKGFVTDGEAKKVFAFDPKTLKVTGAVTTDQPDTDSLTYDPASKLLFSINGDSGNSSVIDPVKETIVKMIDLGGSAEFPVPDGKGLLYDNNEEKSDVVVIDTKSLTIKSRWPGAPAGGLTAMALDLKNHRLFSAGRNPQFLIMMDADNGKVIQSFPIAAGVDAIVFEPDTGRLFVSTREGVLHIYHEDSPDKLSELQSVKTEYGAKTMALDPKTHYAYLSTSDFGPPPPPTEKRPHPLPVAKQGNFRVLVYGP